MLQHINHISHQHLILLESMGELDLDWDISSAGGGDMEEEEEVFASNEGSEEVSKSQ